MEIVITEPTSKSAVKHTVYMQSTFGSMSAVWLGKAPKIGERYTVEIEDILIWGSDITLQEGKEYRLFERDEQKYFWGWIERIDEDGLLMLKVGTSLLMVDTIGEPLVQSGFVEIKASNVSIYNEDV
jgi:hypothetical protein